MKSTSQVWDLIAILVVSLILVPAVLFTSGVLRIVLGLPFLLFFPGYTLIAALFPRKASLGGIERIALSFGLSIAVVPLIGLILNYTPWGIRVTPVLFSIIVFIVAMCGVAWYRRGRLKDSDRFTVPFKIQFPSWQGHSGLDKVLSIVLVVSIVGAIGILGYVIAKPKVGEKFTEFYILGPQGKAEGYPTNIKMGEKGEVILGIVNHEQEEMSYQVKMVLDGVETGLKLWLQEEDGQLSLIDDNTVRIGTLANEDKWEGSLFFEPLKVGEGQKLEFLLFSPKPRENQHIRSQLPDGNYIDITINEAEGKGEVSLDNKSGSTCNYRLEVWQKETVQKEISFTVAGGEKLERDIQYPPGKSIFQLYEGDELVMKDSGAKLSLHLWLDVS